MYYKLPNMNNNFNLDKFKIIRNDNYDKPYICESLYDKLTSVKYLIEEYKDEWDNYKKYTNPYEFINTPFHKNKYLSKYRPISRAYFKMIEIIEVFEIFNNYKSKITSFHLAEGPGGFIEAFAMKRNNKNDKYYGITLIDEKNKKIPGWKCNRLLNKYKNIFIQKGETGNGDLYSFLNLMYFIKHYNNKIDIVTGDGGFDFSVDFDKQETMAGKLIYSQFIYAINILKENGIFILKIFDSFTKLTLDILYLCSCFFKDVYIYKPNTSRCANSEKYLICKGFHIVNYKVKEKLNFLYKGIMCNDEKVYSLFDFDLNNIFINKIEEISCILGQIQIQNILKTILLIIKNNNNEILQKLKENNKNLCIEWCKKYNIQYNIMNIENSFIKNS
jgi:23S rRNA U2552 (ribose-2'-O)-methylase RlmE/FtsJ